MATKTADIKPEAAIRRFDIFAEYNRLKAMKEGQPAAQAKGHGLWLAKLVAARKFRRDAGAAPGQPGKDETPRRRTKWKSLDGTPQTDRLFDKEIVGRMGREFYRKVFSPSVKAEFERGASYESIRDRLRRDWKPED
jgi:hypothetical protein